MKKKLEKTGNTKSSITEKQTRKTTITIREALSIFRVSTKPTTRARQSIRKQKCQKKWLSLKINYTFGHTKKLNIEKPA